MKKKIDYLVMDVDGTLTDGKIYMGNDGESCKAFNIKDGYGIHDMAIPAGIIPIIITGRTSKAVENRCRELGITDLYQGVTNKLAKLDSILSKKDFRSIAYIGDDRNDIPCMNAIKNLGGVIGCPADADRHILNIADFVSDKNGGEGAVRDFIEWLLE